ncbi:MAG: hypothetical protein ACRDTC_27770 [Pseudonocardiaceae bacterium]
MGAAQYQQTFTDLVGQGFRLVAISGYDDGGTDRYAAIWEQRPGPAWSARHGLTSFAHQQDFQQQSASGFRMVAVDGHNANG